MARREAEQRAAGQTHVQLQGSPVVMPLAKRTAWYREFYTRATAYQQQRPQGVDVRICDDESEIRANETNWEMMEAAGFDMDIFWANQGRWAQIIRVPVMLEVVNMAGPR